MARSLSEIVTDAVPVAGALPLIHITDAYRIETIVNSAELTPTDCEFFGQRLLYFFYGRPAYKTRREENSNLLFDFPIVFALRPDANIGQPHRAFPLDTGAFYRGMYKSHFHKDMALDRLSIESTNEGLRKYLGLFYESNFDYYVGRATKNVEIRPTEFELQGLHELARQPTSPSVSSRTPFDERASSVEVQFTAPVTLTGNVLAVILPGVFLGEADIRSRIDAIDPAHLETYDTMHGLGPQGVAAIIYDRLLSVYRREGIVP